MKTGSAAGSATRCNDRLRAPASSYQRVMTYDPRPLLAALPYRPLPLPGARLPKAFTAPWRWKPLAPYNGFTHQERVLVWQVSVWLRPAGILRLADRCDLCGLERELGFHSEDYGDLERMLTLCKECHFAIHQRFRSPAMLEKRLDFVEEPIWLRALPDRSFDLAGWLRRLGVGGLVARLPSPYCEVWRRQYASSPQNGRPAIPDE